MSTWYAYGHAYLVDGAVRGDLVLQLPKEEFAFAVARIYTNQPAQAPPACAAYQQGKTYLDQRDFTNAIHWFEECRAQATPAQRGAAACAGRSLGWQALAELRNGDLAASIRHYCEQGDRQSLVNYVLPAVTRLDRAAVEQLTGDAAVLRVLAAYERELRKTSASTTQEYPPDAYFAYTNVVAPTMEQQQNAAAFMENLAQALSNKGARLPVQYGDVLVNGLRHPPNRHALQDACAANNESLACIVTDDTSRRILTAWVASRARFAYGAEDRDNRDIARKLFGAVEQALTNRRVADVDGIIRLAYDAEMYDAAEQWLALSDKQSPLVQWIESKLLLRQGQLGKALAVLRRIVPKLAPNGAAATLIVYSNHDRDRACLFADPDDPDNYSQNPMAAPACTARVKRVAETMHSEIGLLALQQDDFMLAFAAFVRGTRWEDTASMAEKVLTCAELERYLAEHGNDPALQRVPLLSDDKYFAYMAKKLPFDELERWVQAERDKTNEPHATAGCLLRYVLARRYARAHAWAKALAWMPGPGVHKLYELEGGSVSQQFARFVRAMAQAEDPHLTAEQRADGFAAAGRAAGMEFFGTETAPDWACYAGAFTRDDGGQRWQPGLKIRAVQRNGVAPFARITSRAPSTEDTAAWPAGIATLFQGTTAEIARVNTTWPTPCARFHYRYYAADLMWQGAALLSRNSEQAAHMLHEAGTWLKSKDPQYADRFYKEIANRHGATELGTRVRAKNWLLNKHEWNAYCAFPIAHFQ